MQEDFILEMMTACDELEKQIEKKRERIKYKQLEKQFWSEVDYTDVTTKSQDYTTLQLV